MLTELCATNKTLPVLPIEKVIQTSTVHNRTHLFVAIVRGYRPIFATNDSICKLYIEARKIAAVLYEQGISNYEYVRRVNNWIVDNVRYDDEALVGGMQFCRESYEIDNPLLERKGVCSGKSKLFSVLCGLALIKTELVVGRWCNQAGLHAWNKVLIDTGNGKHWFNVDVTASEHIASRVFSSGKYFLLSDVEFEKTHVFIPNTYSEEYNMLNTFSSNMFGSKYSTANTTI